MLKDLEKIEFKYNPHRGINIDIDGLEDKKIYQLIDLKDSITTNRFSTEFFKYLALLDQSIIYNKIEYVKNNNFEKIISMPIGLKDKQVKSYIELISTIANLKQQNKDLIYLLSTIRINENSDYNKACVFGSSFTYTDDKLLKTTFYFKLRKSSLMDDNYVYDNQYFLDKLYSFNIQNLNCILDDLKECLVNNYFYLRLLGVDFCHDGEVYFKIYIESKNWDNLLLYVKGLSKKQKENFEKILSESKNSSLYLDLVSIVNKIDSKNLNLYFLKKV